MARIALLRQAAAETWLSYTELYNGVRSGKYPGYRIGGKHGKWVTDLDMLQARIEELMQANIRPEQKPEKQYGVLRRISG